MDTIHTPLIAFYRGTGQDHQGRMIDEVLSWEADQLEGVHDYIQWLFPLKEKSAFHHLAPIISEEEISEFKSDGILSTKILESFETLLRFYGFVLQGEKDSLAIVRSSEFEMRPKKWLKMENHNFLRITRILRSMRLIGLDEHTLAFMDCLQMVYDENPRIIGKETLTYWRHASFDRL